MADIRAAIAAGRYRRFPRSREGKAGQRGDIPPRG